MSKRAFIFGLIVIAALIFSLYRAKYGARDAKLEIAEIEQQIEVERARRLDLITELSHRMRQEWIEEYARVELGMVPAKGAQVIRPDQLDAHVGPAAAGPDPEDEG